MNVVFLDIDGVMTHSNHRVRSKQHFFEEFCPIATGCLMEILHKTDSSIVVSSTLRVFYNDLHTIREKLFCHYQLDKFVVGITPFLGNVDRSNEIQAYIDSVEGTELSVDKFIIIDDSDMTRLKSRLVQCESHVGLNEERVIKALQLMI
jgi:hypothetical protein